jgi:acetyl esterase/lipase
MNRYLDKVFQKIQVEEDIVYAHVMGYNQSEEDLKLDIYSPENDTEKKRRTILMVHGGGFYQCTKKQSYIVTLAKIFAQLGYVCVSIDYRLYNQRPDYAKAALTTAYDIELARKFLVQNAERFGIDMDNVAILGGSAGSLASNEACKTPNAYCAFIGLWGSPQVVNEPEKYVDTLLIHGTNDPLIDYDNSVKLYEVLKENHVHVELITLQGALHTAIERKDEFVPRMITFLDERMG